jgi:predicted dehydrogenase
MRFALLGDHPDGVDLACALVESGRHRLLACTAALPDDGSRRWDGEVHRVSDLEEILADPAIEAVIVASPASVRPAQLRRALQSERHVLCVHPPDQTPEIAYEAAMIRNDTGCVLLPILPEATHPAFHRLAEFVHRKDASNSPIGSFRLLTMERGVTDEVLEGVWIPGQKPSFPGWDILRLVGGEIQEVSSFAELEELREGEPVLVAGRFELGGLFQVTLLPRQQQPSWCLTLIGSLGSVELRFPLGWNGPAHLDWHDEQGEPREEYWQRWDPWPSLVETFEQRFAGSSAESGKVRPNWQDTIRALELDDAARRGVERRRSTVLEYPQATEEVGFKGTMTLVGCGLVWLLLLALIVANWWENAWPVFRWMIVLFLIGFLILQLLRYFVPQQREK